MNRDAVLLNIRGIKQALEALQPAVTALPERQRRALPGVSYMDDWIQRLQFCIDEIDGPSCYRCGVTDDLRHVERDETCVYACPDHEGVDGD